MFFNTFLNVACDMQLLQQSRNNNNRPNKKNDVITDLGGEGDFPMFLFASHLLPLSHLSRLTRRSYSMPSTAWRQGNRETEATARLLNRE